MTPGRIIAGLLVALALAAAPLACLGGSSVDASDMSVPALADLSAGPALDLTGADETPPPDLASDQARPFLDLTAKDLTGLFNCYGVAVCDPNAEFCIKYFDGTKAVPGNLVNSPACFQPSDTCGNQGQNMDCGCIQNDASLGTNCQGDCVDNADGTFNCYAK